MPRPALQAAIDAVTVDGVVHVLDGTYPENPVIGKKVTLYANVSGGVGGLSFGVGSNGSVVQPGTPAACGALHVTGTACFGGGSNNALRARMASLAGYDRMYSSGGALTLGGSSGLIIDVGGASPAGTGGVAVPVASFGGGVSGTFATVVLANFEAQRLSALWSYDAQNVFVQVGRGLGTVTSVTVNPVQRNGNDATVTYSATRSADSPGTIYYNVWLRQNTTWLNPKVWTTDTSCTVPGLSDGTYQFYVEARTWQSGLRNAGAYGEYFYQGGWVNSVTVNAPTITNNTAGVNVTFSATGLNTPVPYFQVWIKDWASSAWTRLRTYNLSTAFSTTVPYAGYYQFWVEATTNRPSRQSSGYSGVFEVKGACSNLRITGTSQGGGAATINYAFDETLSGTAQCQVWLRLPSGAWQSCGGWTTNTSCTVGSLTPGAWHEWYIEMRAGNSGARVEGLYGPWFKP